MNVDDLVAYIKQPEKKTKKKAKKKRKDTTAVSGGGNERESAEERSTSVDTTNLGIHTGPNNPQKDIKASSAGGPTARSASTAPAKSNNMFAGGSQGASDRAGSLSHSSVADSAAAGLPDEAVLTQNFSDEQFESAMIAFSQRLEAYCNEKVANHAQRMKPNYDGQWIVSLKVKLEKLDGKDGQLESSYTGAKGAQASKPKSKA